MSRQIEVIADSALIYFSAEDGCWIAHSLRTDQVGTGADMGRALADMIRGIDNLMDVAREDDTIQYLREAPPEIQERARHSKPIPREIYEVAHKIARDEWPEEINSAFSAPDSVEFVAQVCNGSR